MANFSEVMRQWKRMCKWREKTYSMSDETCDACPVKNCGAIFETPDNVNWAQIEGAVMAWSAEHPEPEYPTWGEWFISTGELVSGWDKITNRDALVARCGEVFYKPIPADIAQKLGIEPKEG